MDIVCNGLYSRPPRLVGCCSKLRKFNGCRHKYKSMQYPGVIGVGSKGPKINSVIDFYFHLVDSIGPRVDRPNHPAGHRNRRARGRERRSGVHRHGDSIDRGAGRERQQSGLRKPSDERRSPTERSSPRSWRSGELCFHSEGTCAEVHSS